MSANTLPPFSLAMENLNKYDEEVEQAITKCGIFHMNKLKGRKISNKYRTYDIESVNTLINQLKSIFIGWQQMQHRYEEIVTEDVAERAFQEINKCLEKIAGISRATYQDSSPHINRIKQELGKLKRKITPHLPASLWAYPNKSMLINNLIHTLLHHAPTAPHQTIAARVSDLLKLVNLKIKPETIRKRITRVSSTR